MLRSTELLVSYWICLVRSQSFACRIKLWPRSIEIPETKVYRSVRKCLSTVTYEVLTAAKMSMVFWNVVPFVGNHIRHYTASYSGRWHSHFQRYDNIKFHKICWLTFVFCLSAGQRSNQVRSSRHLVGRDQSMQPRRKGRSCSYIVRGTKVVQYFKQCMVMFSDFV